MALEQLADLVGEDSPMLSRRLRADGKLESVGDRWQLYATEVLKGELEQEPATRAIEKWQRQHGSLSISVREVSSAEESDSVAAESKDSAKPEIVQQAEEIFSNKARQRGPTSS